ncbi:hypothetical protein [Paraburkholderia sp. J67]|uniref:hypothetical protein n=1 Tax=Paraburkholderia sp. J67 TaxID=2805435 RepID=UPI002ABD2929|nr:hypothetical protein [Paraburkholderia sp. J67]
MNASTSNRARAVADGADAMGAMDLPAPAPLAGTLFGPVVGPLFEPFMSSVLASMMAAQLPSAAQWKPPLKAALAWREAFAERVEESAWQWPRTWHLRNDTAGLVEYGRQVAQTAHQLGKQWLDAQLLAAAQWRTQSFALLPQWLDARGQADAALIANEAQQAARSQWDAQNEALMQWFSAISPAFLECLQQWLDDDPGERGDAEVNASDAA